ncbi:hypothetical protein EDB89DRAFT_1989924, partial [Lactarius sanguifluus]
VYSIDLLDSVYPDAVLGNPKETAAHVAEAAGTGKKKRRKAKHRSASEAHHVDAILNRTARQMDARQQERGPHRQAVGPVAGPEGGHLAQLWETA